MRNYDKEPKYVLCKILFHWVVRESIPIQISKVDLFCFVFKVLYESDAVNVEFSIDIQQIIDVVRSFESFYYFLKWYWIDWNCTCLLVSSKNHHSGCYSRVGNLNICWNVEMLFVARYLLFDTCIKHISSNIPFIWYMHQTYFIQHTFQASHNMDHIYLYICTNIIIRFFCDFLIR